MNREIKFRVWNGEEMISPDYITRDGTAHWKENSIPASSKEVMQYTGLKDRNGTGIYEGDVLKSKLGNIYEVRWCKVSEYVKSPPPFKGQDLYEYTGFSAFNIKRKMAYHLDDGCENDEIIGTVYANPELFKTS